MAQKRPFRPLLLILSLGLLLLAFWYYYRPDSQKRTISSTLSHNGYNPPYVVDAEIGLIDSQSIIKLRNLVQVHHENPEVFLELKARGAKTILKIKLITPELRDILLSHGSIQNEMIGKYCYDYLDYELTDEEITTIVSYNGAILVEFRSDTISKYEPLPAGKIRPSESENETPSIKA